METVIPDLPAGDCLIGFIVRGLEGP
jgi:hypothetical protein